MALRNAFDQLNVEGTQQDVSSTLWKILVALENIMARQGYYDPTNASQRVTVANTPAVTISGTPATTISSGTVTTVSTVSASTVNNTNRHATDYDQYAQMNVTAQNLRNFIVST